MIQIKECLLATHHIFSLSITHNILLYLRILIYTIFYYLYTRRKTLGGQDHFKLDNKHRILHKLIEGVLTNEAVHPGSTQTIQTFLISNLPRLCCSIFSQYNGGPQMPLPRL